MGLPALRAFPRIADESTVEIPRDAEREASGPERADDAFDLQTIVEAVFDPVDDRVIYELPPGQPPAAETHEQLWVASGEAIPAATACAAALRRLGRRRFVVAVVHADSVERALSDSATSLDSSLRRIVLVVLGASCAFEAPQSLAASGWRLVDLRDQHGARSIAKALVVTRYDESPTMVVLNAALRLPSEAQQGPSVSLAIAHRSGRGVNVSAALAAEFRQQMTADPRLSAVLLTDDADWQLMSAGGSSSTIVTDRRLGRGLMTALALAHAGCHPVIVVRSGDIAADPESLNEVFSGRKFRGTLVVLDFNAESQTSVRWPEDWEHRVLTADMDPAELRRVSADCLSTVRGTVLHVPARRVATIAPISPTKSNCPKILVSSESSDETVVIAADDSTWCGSPAGGTDRVGMPTPQTADATLLMETAARQIREYRFNPWQQKWVDEYCAVGKRDIYLWRWTARAVEWLTLSCVAPEWRSSVCDTKFLAAMFNVLLDDIVDERRDPSAMVDMQSLMGEGSESAVERLGHYGEFIGRVWREIQRRVREYPREPEFRRLLSYDFRQLCNQIDYSGLLHRHPYLINQTEHDLYSPHGMMVACTATLDLTCSPGFRNEDLGTLREAVWHANSMARIGNLVTTWQREIGHDDFSSGVFARAVSLGRLHADDLSSSNRSAIEAAISEAGIEREFADRWKLHRERLVELAPRIKSVSLLDLLEGLERLMASEYASRGHK
jgi:hypothetical protein